MPVPSQGHYGCQSFPVVDWFCLFIYLWVLTFPLEDCSEFGNFVITLIVRKMVNVRENRGGNQEWTIKRHWHYAHKTQQKNREKTNKQVKQTNKNNKNLY